MQMELRLYPDPVLQRPADPITDFDDALRERVAEMYRIMYEEGGVGLAAPQVGWSAQVLVINPAADKDDSSRALTVINPRLLKKWGKTTDQEGCLSFPEIFVEVERPVGVRLAWQDEHGESHEDDLTDFAARIVLHEKDHLDGVLLVHRMSPVDRIQHRDALDELIDLFARKQARANAG